MLRKGSIKLLCNLFSAFVDQVLTRIETENSSKGRCGIREQGPKLEPSCHEVGERKHSSLKHPCSSACPTSPFPNKSRFLNRREATLNKEYIRTLHNSYNLQTSSQVYWSENTRCHSLLFCYCKDFCESVGLSQTL